jgi:hypothetical protein
LSAQNPAELGALSGLLAGARPSWNRPGRPVPRTFRRFGLGFLRPTLGLRPAPLEVFPQRRTQPVGPTGPGSSAGFAALGHGGRSQPRKAVRKWVWFGASRMGTQAATRRCVLAEHPPLWQERGAPRAFVLHFPIGRHAAVAQW